MSETVSFLQLPEEIRRLIIEEAMPECLPELALTCKSLGSSCTAFVDEYNRNARCFRDFTYYPPRRRTEHGQEGAEIRNCVELLETIAEDPRLARYIKTARFLHDKLLPIDWPEDGDGEEAEYFTPNKSSHADALRRLFQSSPYLRDAGFSLDASMTDMMSALDVNIFLLTLLPNITELTMPSRFASYGLSLPDRPAGPNDRRNPDDSHRSWQGTETARDRGMWRLLDVLVRRANDPGAREKGASLARLETVKPSLGTGYNARGALDDFVPLLSLSSLRNFHGGGCVACDGGGTGMLFRPRYDVPPARAFRSIEMVGCAIAAYELADLLEMAPRLKSLRMAHESKWHGVGSVVDAGAMVHVLSNGVADSLEELRLIRINLHPQTGTVPTMDLKRLTHLKVLELDLRFLLGPAFDLDAEWWEQRYRDMIGQIPQCFDPDILPDERANARLVDILPHSIETVKLGCVALKRWSPEDQGGLRRLFAGLREERAHKLPNLGEVLLTMEGDDPGFDESLRVARDAGAVVVSKKDDVDSFEVTFRRRFGVENMR